MIDQLPIARWSACDAASWLAQWQPALATGPGSTDPQEVESFFNHLMAQQLQANHLIGARFDITKSYSV